MAVVLTVMWRWCWPFNGGGADRSMAVVLTVLWRWCWPFYGGGSCVVCSLCDLVATHSGALFMLCSVHCLIVLFNRSCVALRSLCWGRGSWLLCVSLVCALCIVCQGLSALPLGVIGKLCYVIMGLPRKLITKTCLNNFYPLKPHFLYNSKTWVYKGIHFFFLISATKPRLWVLVRTASVICYYGLSGPDIHIYLYSRLSFSNSKGLSETLRDIRTSKYQSCRSVENNKLNNHI